MNFLLEKGMTIVRLGTAEQNVSSQALLRSLGFRPDSTRKILRKRLAKNEGAECCGDALSRQRVC
jgi:ribosomal protein S18 acetylase RimI-like enzyme